MRYTNFLLFSLRPHNLPQVRLDLEIWNDDKRLSYLYIYPTTLSFGPFTIILAHFFAINYYLIISNGFQYINYKLSFNNKVIFLNKCALEKMFYKCYIYCFIISFLPNEVYVLYYFVKKAFHRFVCVLLVVHKKTFLLRNAQQKNY